MGIGSIARTKKRTGELSFQTKVTLYRESVGEENFKKFESTFLTVGRALYNQLRIDGVLPKRAKAWEKLDYQDQLKWGAAANDVVIIADESCKSASPGFGDLVGGLMGALSPKGLPPEILNGAGGLPSTPDLTEFYKKMGVEVPSTDAPVPM